MPETTRAIVLARRPGNGISEDDFKIVTRDLPEPADEQVLVRNVVLSVDPYMRLGMSDRMGTPAPQQVGELMSGGAVGVVTRSRSQALPEGTMVSSMNGWREAYVADASSVQPVASDGGRPSLYLGILGLTGITAYAGVERLLEPQAGETVFVSGAAGAVGSVVVQLAKRRGCKVLGTAGSAEKISWLRDTLGADAVANYKKDDLNDFLTQNAPEGIDHYFDNVGGETLDAAILALKPRGRIVVCGAISQYNTDNYCAGPSEFFKISAKELRLFGLNVSMWFPMAGEIIPQLAQMLEAGELVWEETAVEGLENMPEAFVSLFRGANLGKMIVTLDGSKG
ncbi:NADP-dependent oxidoreductase [Henriciella litoralis]|uniref:NADP-dependent oxidoreductase n=1 Tax=Henriciella litoralis TaxID=568102 RepID=UPI0009FF7A12|nr:NADP-dependent oxidoreductase [Henriciella litoralis]